MPLRFDAAELQSYLDEVFPQVRGLFVIDEVHEDHLKMRMPVKEAHLRPGGTVSGLDVCIGRLWDVCGHPVAFGERGAGRHNELFD